MHAKTHVQSQMKLQVILKYINYNKGEVENQNVSEPEDSASNTSPSTDTNDLSNQRSDAAIMSANESATAEMNKELLEGMYIFLSYIYIYFCTILSCKARTTEHS